MPSYRTFDFGVFFLIPRSATRSFRFWLCALQKFAALTGPRSGAFEGSSLLKICAYSIGPSNSATEASMSRSVGS